MSRVQLAAAAARRSPSRGSRAPARSARRRPRRPASPGGRRCAGARSLWAMKALKASAVVAKPPGTETPSSARLPIISPSEEFLPPTWARSVRRRSCSHRMLALKAGTPGSMRGTANRTGAGRSVYFSNPGRAAAPRPVLMRIPHGQQHAPGVLRFRRHRHHRRNHRPQPADPVHRHRASPPTAFPSSTPPTRRARPPSEIRARRRSARACARSWSIPASTRSSTRCWPRAGR